MKTINLLVAIGCILCCHVVFSQSKPNVDGTWKIKNLKDAGQMLDLGAQETVVTISAKSKNILLYVGCNRLSGNFEFITGDMIKPLQLVSTRKGCHGEVANIEEAARYVLENTNSVRKNGAKVEFYKNNELLMTLERPTEPIKKKKK